MHDTGSAASLQRVWTSPITFEGTELPPRPSTSAPRIAVYSRLGRHRATAAPSITNTFTTLDHGWKLPAPSSLIVRCSLFGTLTIDGLDAETTVARLKAIIADRICLLPSRSLHLSYWGRELSDLMTLTECKLRNKCTIDMRLSLIRLGAVPRTRLDRVRVACTALETRMIPVDSTTTVLEVKERIAADLRQGQHEWYTKAVSDRLGRSYSPVVLRV